MSNKDNSPYQGHDSTDREYSSDVLCGNQSLSRSTRLGLLADRAIECTSCGDNIVDSPKKVLYLYHEGEPTPKGGDVLQALTLMCAECRSDDGLDDHILLDTLTEVSKEKQFLTEWFTNNGATVPLFATDDELVVKTDDEVRDDGAEYLKRSASADLLLKKEIEKVVTDYEMGDDRYEGVVYTFFVRVEGQIVPLYVGGAGKYGDDGTSLNANMTTNDSKLGRLGYSDYRHLGWLSRLVLGQTDEVDVPPRYDQWVDELFEESRRLKEPVWLWTTAWQQGQSGPDSTPSSLKELEADLIRIASNFYPNRILNIQGTYS